MHANAVDAPRYKGLSIPESALVKPFRDSQVLASDGAQYSSGTLRFFPPTASQSNVDSNFEKNPLPKNRAYDILGLGVGWSLGNWRITPAGQGTLPSGLAETINGATHARLLFETSQKTELVDEHLSTSSAVQGIEYCVEASEAGGTGDGFLRDVKFPSTLVARRSDPYTIDPQETFDFEVEFESTGWLPTISEWNSALVGGYTPKMVATMLVAFR
jgi:hypothetical protein